jgi:hypothetical protein
MTLLALLVLGLRLGQVDVDTRTRVLRVSGYRLDHLGCRGILAVDTQITDQTAAQLAVPLVQQAQIVLVGGKALVVAVVKYGQTAAEVALDAALAYRGHHAVEEEIHIRERNRTARQHFRDGKLRAVVRRFVIDLVLKRKYLLAQPALQRQILRVAAQQRHRRVAVDVVEAAHQQTVSAVVTLTVVLLRLGVTDIGDLAVLHANVLPAFERKILIQQINVAKKHCFLLFSLQNMVMRDNILVFAVLVQKSARNHTKLCESQLFVQRKCARVALDDCVELQHAESARFPLFQAVRNEFFTDMLSAHGLFDGVACVTDMTAASHIIRVQNIQTDQLAGCRVVRYAGIGLLSEKGMTGHLVQLFHLRKGFTVRNDLVPNFC